MARRAASAREARADGKRLWCLASTGLSDELLELREEEGPVLPKDLPHLLTIPPALAQERRREEQTGEMSAVDAVLAWDRR